MGSQVILVGGKWTLGPYATNRNASFMTIKKWGSSFLTRLPVDLPDIFSVCAAPDGFIVSGVHRYTAWFKKHVSLRVRRFSIPDQKWSALPDMSHHYDSHGSVCISSRFFAVGGMEVPETNVSADVCSMDLETFAQTPCQKLVTAVASPGVVALDSSEFLVVGGRKRGVWNGEREGLTDCTQVSKYDAHTGKRSRCQPMPMPCQPHNRIAASGKCVFVLHRDGVFMMYDVLRDQWSELPPPIKPVSWSAMVHLNGSLVVAGGIIDDNTINITDTLQTYDTDNETWEVEKNKLPFPLVSHAAIVANVPHAMIVPNSFDHLRFRVSYVPLIVLFILFVGLSCLFPQFAVYIFIPCLMLWFFLLVVNDGY